MPSLDAASLPWLLWGGGFLGLQGSVSIVLRKHRLAKWPFGGMLYFASVLALTWWFSGNLILLFEALTILVGVGTLISVILLSWMSLRSHWCGACVRVHCANALLGLTVWEAWSSLSLFV